MLRAVCNSVLLGNNGSKLPENSLLHAVRNIGFPGNQTRRAAIEAPAGAAEGGLGAAAHGLSVRCAASPLAAELEAHALDRPHRGEAVFRGTLHAALRERIGGAPRAAGRAVPNREVSARRRRRLDATAFDEPRAKRLGALLDLLRGDPGLDAICDHVEQRDRGHRRAARRHEAAVALLEFGEKARDDLRQPRLPGEPDDPTGGAEP